jgi:hypothetical protein
VNSTLLKALLALLPVLLLFAGAVVLFVKRKAPRFFLQLLGAGCLVLVPLAHIAEALHVFPWMRWGLEHSPGHYLDLGSAVLGLALFPLGYLLHALKRENA